MCAMIRKIRTLEVTHGAIGISKQMLEDSQPSPDRKPTVIQVEIYSTLTVRRRGVQADTYLVTEREYRGGAAKDSRKARRRCHRVKCTVMPSRARITAYANRERRQSTWLYSFWIQRIHR